MNDLFKHITFCNTDEDNLLYPGKLNVDENGDPIITHTSTQEDYDRSRRITDKKHGITPLLELGVKYNNPNFTQKDLNPNSKINPLSGTDFFNIQDRGLLMKKLIPHVTDEDFNPVLMEPKEPITYKHFLPDLNPYALVGDPRFTLGCALQTVYQEFVPRIKACEEIAEAGGVGVKEDCICSEDGQQIRKASDTVMFAANRTLLDPTLKIKVPCFPTAQEIETFFNIKRDLALANHAEAFVRYIKLCYLSNPLWHADPVLLPQYSFFFVKLVRKESLTSDKIVDKKYLKYYSDQANYVADLLGTNLIQAEDLFLDDEANNIDLTSITKSLTESPEQSFYGLNKLFNEQFIPKIPGITELIRFGEQIPDYTSMACPSGII